jgi:hypothetical protein
MQKYLTPFVLIILLPLFLGCEDNKDLLTNPDVIIPSDSVIVALSPIDSKLIVMINEVINPSNRNVVLTFYTEKMYSPAGSKILGDFIQENNTFKIELEGLFISNCGAAIFSHASVTFNLGSLHQAFYLLDIIVNNTKLLGKLTVSKESFELRIQPNNLIYIFQEKLLRVPSKTIWGQAESIKPTPYRIFLDSLIVLGAQAPNLKPGDYYCFKIDSNGNFSTKSVLGMPYGEFFIYKFEGDTSITRNLVKRFAKHYLDSIYIQLMGGRGEMFYSTVLKNEP